MFHLKDGTRSVHAYDPRSGELYLGEYPGEDVSNTDVVLTRDIRALLRPAPWGRG
jgi:hypothetical protein